jgi:type I restriction enzyme, S subunit
MSFPRYETYKDSGVEWLGEVPAHWNMLAIKWLSPVLRGASPRPIDDPKYFNEDGEFAWVRIADVSASDGVLRETTQRLSSLGSSLSVKADPGALFVTIAGTVGKPCITAIKACIHDGFVYFPRLAIDPRFLFRVFECGSCYAGLGKMGTQLNLNTETIGSIRVALPPPDEVARLIAFLDNETAKIDALVEEQKRLIELLKEKRQAVISHAVTKGLNPNAPMKDSGVAWLGEVPAHWVVKSIKWVSPVLRGASPRPIDDQKYFDDDGEYAWVRIADASASEGVLLETRQRLSELGSSLSVKLEPGELFVSIAGTVGKPCIAGIKCCIHDGFVYFPRLGIDPRFLFRLFEHGACYAGLGKMGTQLNLNTDTIGSIRVGLPPIDEIQEILRFIDAETGMFDELVSEAESAMNLLQERRTALISAAVTGKIDVRASAQRHGGHLAG